VFSSFFSTPKRAIQLHILGQARDIAIPPQLVCVSQFLSGIDKIFSIMQKSARVPGLASD